MHGDWSATLHAFFVETSTPEGDHTQNANAASRPVGRTSSELVVAVKAQYNSIHLVRSTEAPTSSRKKARPKRCLIERRQFQDEKIDW